jgi:hypothetical protein
MDLTYIVSNLGVSRLLFNFTVEPLDPTFLVLFTDPCGTSTKNVLFFPDGCDGNWIVVVDSVNEAYESLLDGIIYFGELGTWEAKIYVQDGTTNTDPDNAEFLANVLVQVVCDEDQFLLDNPLDLPL